MGQTLARLGKKNRVKVVDAINGEGRNHVHTVHAVQAVTKAGLVAYHSSLTLTGAVLKIQPHYDMDRDVAGQLVELFAKLMASVRNNIKSYSETEKAYFLSVRMKEWEIVVVPGEYGWSK